MVSPVEWKKTRGAKQQDIPEGLSFADWLRGNQGRVAENTGR